MSITEIYEAKCNDNSDICQHLPTLKRYAEECRLITELGVRSIVSTWAFLAAKPIALTSIDIHHPSYYKDYDKDGCNLELAEQLAKEQGTSFLFVQEDSLKSNFPNCDLIFFDTLHTYEQLSQELKLHGNKSNKFLIFHDTETYHKELIPAITDFMVENRQWMVYETFFNNNGLIVLINNNYVK